ncbi:MAG: hypothetical protein KAR13_03780, partial [Desulfobulbaceae bacterium]|nr:hypothetical protein [Desulfobulbaceae bacterium]
LTAALMDILRRTASGTAASVISNSRAGEGAIYQAVFYPNQLDAMGNEVDWIGDVHSLWIDKYGNIREDCGGADGSCGETCNASCACDALCPKDNILDLKKDYIIEFYTNEQGSARAKRFEDTNGKGEYDPLNPVETNIPLQDIRYLWDAGNWLATASHTQKSSYTDTTDERYIFTWLAGANDDSVAFTTTAFAAAATIKGYDYFRYFNATDATKADKIINFIRGLDQSGCRSRQIDWDGDGTAETYKLGDIIHSTPTIVARPAEDYDMIYADPTYQSFRKKYGNRRTMIYAGGNDGGLHAFNGGYYDRNNKEFLKAPPSPAGLAEYDLGAEMWMFIPYNLLPHLKWLTDPDYGGSNHVYYVDLKPKIFDARIFDPDDGIHAGGWGTVLVGGMRFGGGEIGVDLDGDLTDETTMRSAYFVLDITNPECPPVILAEFTDADLGFTTCYPTAIPMVTCDRIGQTPSLVDDCPDPDNPSMDWYIAFGSGPHPADQAAMQGTSDQLAKLYILKLGDTTTPIYETTPQLTPSGSCPTLFAYNRPAGPVAGYPVNIDAALTNSFFSDVITVDFDLSYQTEALYLGSVYNTNAATLDGHKGAMHRLTIDDNYSTPAAWSLDTFIDVERPVTASPSVAYDGTNFWIYFGTGRFLTSDDKTTTAQESYYGIKEPVDVNWNPTWPTYGGPPFIAPAATTLMDVSGVDVTNATGTLSASVGGASTFGELWSSEINLHDGWKFDFDLSGERNIGQAAILGDIVAFSSYVPSDDYCSVEGDSYLYVVYYLTGTSYYKSVIGVEEGTDYIFKKTSLGKGLATTPNIHSGVADTAKSFVQTSTGAVIKIEQDNPGVIKSGPFSWRELE